MHGHDVEALTLVAKGGDDYRAPHSLAREPAEPFDTEIVDLESGQQCQTPFAGFGSSAGPTKMLWWGERTVFSEVEAVLAGEVGEARLPGSSP